MFKVVSTLRNHWKKSVVISCAAVYAAKLIQKWYRQDLLLREYCLQAREYGRHTLTAHERPRKIILFLNPAAKDNTTRYLVDKYVLPILHLAGIEVHVVKTEHEGQAKAYMSVIDNNIVDGIVIAGGDGTLSEIVTGLLRRSDGIAKRLPIGVIPLGKTNSFAGILFPEKELEVERYCQASMAVVRNYIKPVDVIEVKPDQESADSRRVYLMSHIKWGVHSEIYQSKEKYWYLPGPLKQYFSYMKQAVFGEWPPRVKADVDVYAPCGGCMTCFIPQKQEPEPAKAVKSWWWSNNRKPVDPVASDPRLKVENPECGAKQSIEIETPQLDIINGTSLMESGENSSMLILRYSSPVTSKTDFMANQGYPQKWQTSIPASQIHIVPKTENPWYIMDSEKFETLPATIKLLKDSVRVFHYEKN